VSRRRDEIWMKQFEMVLEGNRLLAAEVAREKSVAKK
jgi:hypothetical protein